MNLGPKIDEGHKPWVDLERSNICIGKADETHKN